mmetsp:Transcript_11170/g.24918  ORF Transcript_11170/g.24918 Transcript_11170/m.24918 type:complete len:190 (+) Transcript_11170:157-726(+)
MGQRQSRSLKQMRSSNLQKRRGPFFWKQESSHTLSVSGSSDSSGRLETDSSTISFSNDTIPEGIQEYYLKKRRRTNRNGLRWQEDPTGQDWLRHERHWPRDYATLRGTVVAVRGKKWLLVTQVKQLGSDKWHKAPKGAAIPFFYGKTYCLVSTMKAHRRPSMVSFRASCNSNNKQRIVTFAEQVETICI